MRKFYTKSPGGWTFVLLIFYFFPAFTNGQVNFPTCTDSFYLKTFQHNKQDGVGGLFQLPGGNLIVYGLSNGFFGVSKHDVNGNMIFSKSLDPISYYSMSKVLPDFDGTLFIASENSANYYQMDTLGSILTAKKITDKEGYQYSLFRDMAILPNGDKIILFQDNVAEKCLIARLSKDLSTVIWSKFLHGSNFGAEVSYLSLLVDGQKLFLCGSASTYFYQTFSASVLQLDINNGNLYKEKRFKLNLPAPSLNGISLSKIMKYNDGYLLLAHMEAMNSLTNNDKNAYVRFDTNMNVISIHGLKNVNNDFLQYGNAIDLYTETDGSLYGIHGFSTQSMFLIDKYDSVKWAKTLYAYVGFPKYLIKVNSGFISTGYQTYNNVAANREEGLYYLLKYSSNGDVPNCNVVPNNISTFAVPFIYDTAHTTSTDTSILKVTSIPFTTINSSLNVYSNCTSISTCNSIQLLGATGICSLNPVVYTIKRNPGCSISTELSITPSPGTIQKILTDSTISISFFLNGNYIIKAMINTTCGKFADSIVVKVTNLLQLDLGKDTVLCPSNTILLNAKNGFASYQWQDGSTDSTFTVTAPGTYFVKTTNGCGGVFYDTVIVSSHPPIPFDIGPDLTKCNSDTLTVTAPTGFINYIWTPAYNINSTTSQTVKLYPSVDTIYKVKAEKTPGCFAYDSLRVKVYSSPKINLGLDRNFCFGDSVVLNAGTGFSQYLWSTGNISQQIVVKNAGTYFVAATTTNNCTSKDTITILSVYPNPVVKLDHDSTLCIGAARILNAGNFVSYLWNTGNTSQLLSINTIGMYSVTVTDNNNCKGSDSVKIVTILPSPFNFLPGDTSVCSYGTLQLSSKAAFSKYLWNTNAVTSSINITQPGIYWLQVKDFNNCTGKDSIIVAQKDCLKGFFIPNAFSPNNDGKNDIYRPMLFGKVMQYEFAIYNQWGEIVFKSVDVNKGWDGKYKALPQDGNIFIWTCKYQFENEPIKIEKGTVLLLR